MEYEHITVTNKYILTWKLLVASRETICTHCGTSTLDIRSLDFLRILNSKMAK